MIIFSLLKMCFITVGRKYKRKVNFNEHYCTEHFTLKSSTTTECIHRYAEMLWSLCGWFLRVAINRLLKDSS